MQGVTSNTVNLTRQAKNPIHATRDDSQQKAKQCFKLNFDLNVELKPLLFLVRTRAVENSNSVMSCMATREHSLRPSIVVINMAGFISSINSFACRLFGYPEADLLGKCVDVLLPTWFRMQQDKWRQFETEKKKKKVK